MDRQKIKNLLYQKFGDSIEKRLQPLEKQKVEDAIKQVIQKYLSEKDLSTFGLPDEYFELINLFEGNLSQDLSDGTWWNLLYSYESMLSDLDYEYENVTYYKKEQTVLNCPIFIPVGAWSDKHIYFLSCDTSFEFGKVFDCHDDYFWNLPARENPVSANILDLLQNEFNT
ncbi:MAG: hypothetical protein MUC49_12605 [Raineya sp.]|jgi:hypothetical protein|nr:hypothetical protein [Raineya sp.]